MTLQELGPASSSIKPLWGPQPHSWADMHLESSSPPRELLEAVHGVISSCSVLPQPLLAPEVVSPSYLHVTCLHTHPQLPDLPSWLRLLVPRSPPWKEGRPGRWAAPSSSPSPGNRQEGQPEQAASARPQVARQGGKTHRRAAEGPPPQRSPCPQQTLALCAWPAPSETVPQRGRCPAGC